MFDSGLGGLALATAIRARLPQYNYLYLGDTKRVPYGNRSQATIHEFVGQALDFLFQQDCRLVILACNTASAEALRKSQQEYLPSYYPERRVLGVLIPTVEAALEGSGDLSGVLATSSTVASKAYEREFARIEPSCSIVQVAAPLLVPLIENDGVKYLGPVLDDYLEPFNRQGVTRLVLGCTHYCLIKDEVRKRTQARVLSQDEIVPDKLADYLERHPEMESHLAKGGQIRYCVTDEPVGYGEFVTRLVGEPLEFEPVVLH